MTHNLVEPLFVDDGGTGGVPIVFLHSAGGTSSHWTAQLAHLRPGRRAIAFDLPGHGRSRPPADGDYSVGAFARAVGAAVDSLGLDRFVLVGHSYGGAVSVACAGSWPDRVVGLLLLDPASDGRQIPREQAEGIMQALRSDAYQATIEAHWSSLMTGSAPAMRDRLLAGLRSTPRDTVIGTFEAMLSFDPVTPLSRYRGPRLSVITQCNETPAALHRLVPGLPCRKLEGTGHWLQLDAPETVNGILDELLEACRKG